MNVTTGSAGPKVGSMHFMKSGEIIMESSPMKKDLTTTDATSLMITQEYIVYALSRDDWMLEFLGKMNKDLREIERNSQKPNLTLIHGGLGDTDLHN